MYAAIDVGSNTIRLLIVDSFNHEAVAKKYYRKITRLSGRFANYSLHSHSMQRTLEGLQEFSSLMRADKVVRYRAVATEAVRRAQNSALFLDMVRSQAGIDLEVIPGETEAQLTTAGVLSVITPAPKDAIIIDIGGGSTELICVHDSETLLQRSYPLGVVRLCEELNTPEEREIYIDNIVTDFLARLRERRLDNVKYQLIGTAGTVTTLAAIHLQLKEYNADLVNNHYFSDVWLREIYRELEPMSIPEREKVTGMEAGRGDLIIPGIQILRNLSEKFKQPRIGVSDSGLLEGIITDMTSV